METYVPLWCKSNFSFLEGASHPEELVEQAQVMGLPAVAITDRDGVYGVVRAHVRAKELGMRIVLGAQVTVDDGSFLVLLAQSRQGYANLCRLVTHGRLRCAKGSSSVSWEEVCEAASGLLALWGGEGSRLTRPQGPGEVGHELQDAFGDRLYAMSVRHRTAQDVCLDERLRAQAERLRLPVVAVNEVLYHSQARRPLQDVLTCIRHGVTLHEASAHTRPNAEHDLKAPQSFRALFEDDPSAVVLTHELLERCTFDLGQLRYRYPAERLPDGSTSAQWLRKLCFEGALWRYDGRLPEDVRHQLDKELALIDELDYPGYFLTMWEIVEYCRARKILCQGRGSAANSVVCYVLGITAVDPVRMDLLFERFLSRERSEPPDIDLDIAHERREEVIQWVYEKYGRSRAAMVANFIRYRMRSAIREVGKALGISETALDRLAKLVHRYEGEWGDMLDHAGLDRNQPLHHHLMSLVSEIQDFPRHLSIHPGGFLLGHEPVHEIVPIENASMENRTVIQWDKEDIESLGLFKVDLLGLGSLAMVDRCLELMREHESVDLTLATIPHDDSATYDMCCKGDTVGVFQIESRAQMSMLPRLRPRNFYDLVIQVSIVRPGPIAGGMVHPYLRRRHGQEAVEYPHPSLEPVLKRTLGVPIFQEQVMKLAMVAADYTPGEADQLRRDMAAWRRGGRIERHRARMLSRMQRKGIPAEFAERVFEQIKGFGEYGFPESHAASFALITYATAWLKCHHPAAFVCALLNAQPMGFYSPATLIEDAKRHDVPFLPVDVTRSEWDCSLTRVGSGLAVRMGLRYVKGLGEEEGRRFALQRRLRPLRHLEDLVRGSRFNERELTLLAEGGALEGLGLDRRQALWEVRRLVRSRKQSLPLVEKDPPVAFDGLNDFETITWDYRATSHSPRGHPLKPLRHLLRAQGLPTARELSELQDGAKARYAGLVICRQRPGTAKGVLFMTLEDETGFANIVIWKDVSAEHTVPLKTEPFLGVTGKIQKHDGVVHLISESFWIPRLRTPPSPKSRNFR